MSRAGKPVDDQVKLKKILDELTKREENKFCADCGCRGPRWASINLGVFICIACSGIHRSLGVHLTFVRSVNLDSWTSEQVQQMQKWGNARAKDYYEANVPRDYRVPNEHSSVREKEMWIRDKYERKRFVRRDGDGSRRRKEEEEESSEEEEEEDTRRRSRRDKPRSSNSRTNSREAAAPVRTRAPEPAPKVAAPVADILSFDAFSTPTPAPVAQPPAAPAQFPPPVQPAVAPAPAAKQDEWASFSGSSGAGDAFSAPPANQHSSKMANIMASFGAPSAAPTGFPGAAPMGGMGVAPGMASGMAPGMGMHPGMGMPGMPGMPAMGGMGMAPTGMSMGIPMGMPMGMGAPQQQFMNPMMQQGGMNPMMAGGNGFPGAMVGGFPQQQQPMGMMNQMGGMQMNPAMGGGFAQQQHQQQQQQPQPQQQQQQQGGLNQPFVNLGASGGSNPFF